jgi:hypothetical protein
MRGHRLRVGKLAERCGDCPTPAVPSFNLPGSRRSSATSSGTEFAGSEGCTTSTFGPRIMLVTGWKLPGRYGRLRNRE